MLTPWKENYDQPRQHIKKPTYYCANKVRLVKAMVFSVIMCGCESWTVKKAEHRRIDAFAPLPFGERTRDCSPGQNTGVGGLSILQGTLPNPGSEPRSPALCTAEIFFTTRATWAKGLARVFNTTVQKHQFFGAQLSSQSNFHIHT